MLYRDPATGLIRSDSAPVQKVNLPPAQRAATATRPIPQLPNEQTPTTSTQSLPRRILGGIGNFGKEIVNFAARPLVAPLAGLSEDVAALARGENPWTGSPTYRPQMTALSRYAFQNTAPDSAERGYAALSRATEAATFLPELLLPGGVLTRPGASLLRRGLSSAAVEAPFGAALGYLDAKRRSEDNALKQAVAGGGIAAGISIALPFAGAALRRAASPFIPSLSRTGARVAREAAQATEGVLPKAARDAAETAAGPVLPSATSPVTRTASEAVPEVLPSAAATEAPSVARGVSGGVIPEDVAMRVVAGSEDQALTSKVVAALRDGSPDVFTQFGEETVMKVLKALDDQAAGLGASVERTVADNIVAKNIARQQAERQAGAAASISEKVGQFVANAKAKLVDFAAPVEDVLNKTEKDLGVQILPQQDVRKQIDMILRAPETASRFIRDNGLDQVVTEAEKRGGFDQLSEYLVARQNEDIRAVRPGVELGRSAAEDRALIRSLEGKVGDLATKVNDYARKLLDTAVEGGLVGKEAADELKKTYPNYVPINRVFSVIENEGGFVSRGQVASISKQTVVQSLKGSKRAIQNPIQSLVERTQDVIIQSERNKAAQMMARYRNLPGNPFGIKALAEGMQPAAGKERFNVLIGGKKQSFQIEPEFARVISTATPLQLGLIERTLLLPTRVLKAGATGLNIPFTLFNLIKDQITGVLNSSKAAATSNPYVFMKALFEAVTHGELYKEAVRQGAVTTSYALLRNEAALNVSRARARAGIGNFIAHIVRDPMELLRLPGEGLENLIGRGEEVRRLQEFIGTKASLLKQGASESSANILSADAARFVTANFYRRGEWGRVLNAAFPYMGAGIQGTRSFFRAMGENPVGTSAKVIGLIMLPFAVTTAWNLKDPARKAAYDDIPDWEKENNLIIIPPVPKKDENGRWIVYKIPLPPNVGSMVIPIRQTFEAAHGLNPARFAGMAQALIGSTTPLNIDFSSKEATKTSLAGIATPQIIKPSIESYANKSFFTGAPIVPEKLAGLPSEMQKRETTSNTAIAIARQLGVSPLKVEAFLKSSGGTVANQVLNALDRATVATGINPNAQIGGESITANIARRSFRAAGGEQESRMYEAAGKLKIESAGKSAALKQQASSIVDQLEKLSAREGLQLKRELLSGDMKLRKAVQNEQEDRRKGLTTSDKIIKSLNISDGARAKYIKQLEGTMAPDEIKAFESNLRRKKILTADVAKQLHVTLPPR